MHDHCAHRNLLRCPNHAYKRIVEQGGADPLTLPVDIDSQTGKDRNWDRKVLR